MSNASPAFVSYGGRKAFIQRAVILADGRLLGNEAPGRKDMTSRHFALFFAFDHLTIHHVARMVSACSSRTAGEFCPGRSSRAIVI